MSRPESLGVELNAPRPGEVRPAHKAFSWVDGPDKDGNADFAALTMDVCKGMHTCLQLIHSTDIANSSGAEEEYPPVLGIVDKERLLLLAQAAARMLSDRASERVEELNKKAWQTRKEGSQ